jgi:hypothetical protein
VDISQVRTVGESLDIVSENNECRMTLSLDRRGQWYDVPLITLLRYRNGEWFMNETLADIHHPLWEKWQRVLGATLQREAKEEE